MKITSDKRALIETAKLLMKVEDDSTPRRLPPVTSNIEHLLEQVRGGNWEPKDFLSSETARDLTRSLKRLRAKLDRLNLNPTNQEHLQRIDRAIHQLEVESYENDVRFLQVLLSALLDAKEVVELLHRNPRLRKSTTLP